MALNQTQVGAQNNSDGATIAQRAGKQGDAIVSELHGRYFEQNYRGNVYGISVAAAAAITAYTGGAAGTPMIAVYNPVTSGKNLSLISANYANVVAASAAGTATFGLYYGKTAVVTATANATPYNQASLLQAGSVMSGFTNTALTAGSAATSVMPLGSYYWATAAGATLVTQVSPAELAGQIVIPPGGFVALGGSAALTSATWIGALIWEEVPV
jgi:hypothetical protein